MRIATVRSKPLSKRSQDADRRIMRDIVRADFSADYVPLHKQRIDLSNGENPLGNAASVTTAMGRGFSLISHYPERGHDALIGALAHHHALPLESLFVGSGATGCIQNVVMAFIGNGDHVLLPELSFPLPIFAATAMGGGARKAPVRKDFRIDFEAMLQMIDRHTRLIFLCNPNNPTGLLENPADILAFARQAKIPVLVSEANIEYAGVSLLESFAAWPENLIVVRSFSKIHGLAGLRVGFGVAAPAIVKKIMKFQLPFAVSRLSLTGAIAALKDTAHIDRSIRVMRTESGFIDKELSALGFKVLPTDSNLVLAQLPPRVTNDDLFAAALEREGITVIRGSAFSPDLKRWIRLSPRKRKTNMAFIAGVTKILTGH